MYTKEEASQVKEQFWKTFGQYMSYVPSADGRPRINWINYKTGIKSIQFRMFADKKSAHISFSIIHKDEVVQSLIWEQLLQLKSIINSHIDEQWEWLPSFENENYQTASGIFLYLKPTNIFDQSKWPDLISFFKKNLIALDALWQDIQFAFDEYKYL